MFAAHFVNAKVIHLKRLS